MCVLDKSDIKPVLVGSTFIATPIMAFWFGFGPSLNPTAIIVFFIAAQTFLGGKVRYHAEIMILSLVPTKKNEKLIAVNRFMLRATNHDILSICLLYLPAIAWVITFSMQNETGTGVVTILMFATNVGYFGLALEGIRNY